MEELFKALSEKVRLRILSILLEQEMCVCEIECILNLTQSNASRHLSVLRKSGILESYRKAQWTYYRVNRQFTKEHELLWEYLYTDLKHLDSYSIDSTAYEKCKTKNVCGNSTPPH